MRNADKARVISALLTDGVTSDHPLSQWVYILKKDGIPIVSEAAGPRLKHRILDTTLRPDEVLARRRQGLASALRWQRSENPAVWPELLQSIPCPFARDEAAEYLRGIVRRQKVVDSMQGAR